MKSIFSLMKKAVKDYFRKAAENYSIRCTGDVFIPAP